MKSIATRIHRRLALAFPHEFQMIYGADVIQLGEQAINDLPAQHGLFNLIRLLVDIVVRLLIEYLSEMRQDLAYALRTLLKARGFAAAGILSLGLGIGLATMWASEFLNLILRDMPGAKNPDQLVMLLATSYPYFENYRDQHGLFAGAAAFEGPLPFNVSINSSPDNRGAITAKRVFGHIVSPEYFSVIGVRAAQGRTFNPQIDMPGSAAVVFISDLFWRQRMDADPGAVGRVIRVNGQTATIVGIGPQGFLGATPITPAEMFLPVTSPSAMVPELAGDVIHKWDARNFKGLFRLSPGVTLKSAEAGLDAIRRHLDEQTLDPARHAKERRIALLPGGKMAPIPPESLPVLMAMPILLTGLILGIVCMNLANIQLARATARQREMAIRLSVGASRFRLIRQLLTESVLLASAGGCAGISLAYWAAAGFRHVKLPVSVPVDLNVTPDWHALLIALSISFAAGVGFGLAPALTSTQTHLASTLKDGALEKWRRQTRFGLRNLIMVTQVAGSLMLLLLAGFLVIGDQKTNRVDVAFDPSKMVLISLDPLRDGYSSQQAASFFELLPERLKHTFGVQEVALADAPPFSPLVGTSTFSAVSGRGARGQVVQDMAKQTVGATYFSAISVKVLEGRDFDLRDERIDGQNVPRPVILNQSAARELFGHADPIRGRITESSLDYEVVGVVNDLSAPLSSRGSEDGPEIPVIPTVYIPLTRSDFARPPVDGFIALVRTTQTADTLAAIRHELSSLDPNLAMFNVRTLADQIEEFAVIKRLTSVLYGAIGSFSLILAVIGLAGLTAYSVVLRRREIGIRIALGARRGQVLRLVMKEGGILLIVGSVLGFVGGIGAARALSSASSVFGPSFVEASHAPVLMLGAPLLLAGFAMLACYLPARRSMKIDPMTALRQE